MWNFDLFTGLPERESEDFHPLQSINKIVERLQNYSQALWEPGNRLCIDEGRIVSKAAGDPYKTHMVSKPIRSGRDDIIIADEGAISNGYTLHNITVCGSKTYDNRAKKQT